MPIFVRASPGICNSNTTRMRQPIRSVLGQLSACLAQPLLTEQSEGVNLGPLTTGGDTHSITLGLELGFGLGYGPRLAAGLRALLSAFSAFRPVSTQQKDLRSGDCPQPLGSAEDLFAAHSSLSTRGPLDRTLAVVQTLVHTHVHASGHVSVPDR